MNAPLKGTKVPLVIWLLCTFLFGFGGSGLIPSSVINVVMAVWLLSGFIGQVATDQRIVTPRNALMMFGIFALGVVSGWVTLALNG